MRMSRLIVSVEANWHTTFDSAIQRFWTQAKKPLFTQLKFTTTSLNLFVTKIQRKICTLFVDAVISLLVSLFLSENYESYNDINNNSNNNK